MEKNKNSFELTFGEIFQILKKNLLFIGVVSVIFALLSFLFTRFLVTPQYKSEATLIINNRREDTVNVTSDELNTAKNLAGVYSIMIKSDTVLDQVIDNLDLEITAEEMAKNITVSAVDATQVIKVAVTTDNAEKSLRIANNILKVAPPFIVETVEAGSVKTISEAKLNENPVSPNIKVNTLLGFLLGFILANMFVLVIYMLDRTFKSEKQIEEMLEIPVIGVIPNYDSVRRIK